MMKNEFVLLPLSFYMRNDVTAIAKELLGKVLVTTFNGERTAGRIVETEAYEGEEDKACHAHRGRTARTEVMYRRGGYAYIYLCYGLHQMFNVVTGEEGLPHAVLIRAVEPLQGIDVMQRRRGKTMTDYSLTRGPGNVGKAFGFHVSQSGLSLLGDEAFIAEDGNVVQPEDVGTSPRIGVGYAGECAAWAYRFYVKESRWVS